MPTAAVDLFWLPLGAGTGGWCVRLSGRAFERVEFVIAGSEDANDDVIRVGKAVDLGPASQATLRH